jgi:hypothetical protein
VENLRLGNEPETPVWTTELKLHIRREREMVFDCVAPFPSPSWHSAIQKGFLWHQVSTVGERTGGGHSASLAFPGASQESHSGVTT